MTHIPNTFYDNFSQPLSQMSFISSCENENDYETTERERERNDESGRARERNVNNRLERSTKCSANLYDELHSVHGGLKLEC